MNNDAYWHGKAFAECLAWLMEQDAKKKARKRKALAEIARTIAKTPIVGNRGE